MPTKFKIGQKVIWVKNYVIEKFGDEELKNKLKNGLLTGTVRQITKDGDCLIIFDEDLKLFHDNGIWLHNFPYTVFRPLNGIEHINWKIKKWTKQNLK